MADFNPEDARSWHQRVMTAAQRIRDGITNDVINYYYDNAPSDESAQATEREGLLRYLRNAREDINALIDRELSN